MTHNELRDYIDKFDAAGMVDFPAIKAIRAVVELHKPENATLQSWFKLLNNKAVIGCKLCNDFYPCPTIQAIEKELT
jgi:hypothetical protein